jgi:4-carboxymuconolactone decarboxylase
VPGRRLLLEDQDRRIIWTSPSGGREMARIEQVERDKLSARQQALYDDIMRTRPRGKLSGPFSVWIHRPDIAEPANGLANCFRVSPKLDKCLIELIVLLVCRDATAQYAWSAHFNLAREAGISAETIEAIRARRRPEFGRDDERIVYDLVTELLASKKVSPATYGRAEAALGRDGIIEAVTCAGFYGMIGLVLNTFEIPPQPGGDVLT